MVGIIFFLVYIFHKATQQRYLNLNIIQAIVLR